MQHILTFFSSEKVFNTKSHKAFRSYFELSITHYLNDSHNSKLGMRVIFNAQIRVRLFF